MSRLTFTLKQATTQRIDVSCLTPDRLTGLSVDQVSCLPLFLGNRKLNVADVFSFSGDDVDEIVIGGSATFDRVGQAMSHGKVRVDGDAGAYVGADMRGGEVMVSGSIGIFGACGMSGGMLSVSGDAGAFLGGALPGEMCGMRGGLVRIGGHAGDRVGDRMRRGAILIAGNAGDYCASRMIAGTVAVLGQLGACAGYGMTRGTVLCMRPPQRMLTTFNECGTFEFTFLPLLFRQWKALGAPFDQLVGRTSRAQRYMGDLGAGGKGELLILA